MGEGEEGGENNVGLIYVARRHHTALRTCLSFCVDCFDLAGGFLAGGSFWAGRFRSTGGSCTGGLLFSSGLSP